MIKSVNRNKIAILWGLILIVQGYYFADYLSPFGWRQIKVEGLACTCPDEKVLQGQLTLKKNTPDSLKKYELDYSEIYVTERPSTNIDPMGVSQYIIQGQIIGKDRVSPNDPWNPILRVEYWRKENAFREWVIRGFLILQLLIWLILVRNRY